MTNEIILKRNDKIIAKVAFGGSSLDAIHALAIFLAYVTSQPDNDIPFIMPPDLPCNKSE